jgi:hypothetical protein
MFGTFIGTKTKDELGPFLPIYGVYLGCKTFCFCPKWMKTDHFTLLGKNYYYTEKYIHLQRL